jgi:hypothetical protein
MTTPAERKSKEGTVALVLMALTIVASLVSAVPGFLSLREKKALLVFEQRDSEMLLVRGQDEAKVSAILEKENLPDALTTIRLKNCGKAPAKEVRISCSAPGTVVAYRTDPAKKDHPAWVDFPTEVKDASTSAVDGSPVSIRLWDFGVGPIMQVDVSYRRKFSLLSKKPDWQVFVDGVAAIPVPSLDSPADKTTNNFVWRTVLVFVFGFFITVVVTLSLRIRSNPLLRSTLLEVGDLILPVLRLHGLVQRHRWRAYKDDVVAAVAQGGADLISFTDGNLSATTAEGFWDAIIEIKGKKIGLEVHTGDQEYPGLVGELPEQKHYALRIISMARAANLKPVIVVDIDLFSAGTGQRLRDILLGLCEPSKWHSATFVHGTPTIAAAQILKLFTNDSDSAATGGS